MMLEILVGGGVKRLGRSGGWCSGLCGLTWESTSEPSLSSSDSESEDEDEDEDEDKNCLSLFCSSEELLKQSPIL